jgi:hypothetical protein
MTAATSPRAITIWDSSSKLTKWQQLLVDGSVDYTLSFHDAKI